MAGAWVYHPRIGAVHPPGLVVVCQFHERSTQQREKNAVTRALLLAQRAVADQHRHRQRAGQPYDQAQSHHRLRRSPCRQVAHWALRRSAPWPYGRSRGSSWDGADGRRGRAAQNARPRCPAWGLDGQAVTRFGTSADAALIWVKSPCHPKVGEPPKTAVAGAPSCEQPGSTEKLWGGRRGLALSPVISRLPRARGGCSAAA